MQKNIKINMEIRNLRFFIYLSLHQYPVNFLSLLVIGVGLTLGISPAVQAKPSGNYPSETYQTRQTKPFQNSLKTFQSSQEAFSQVTSVSELQDVRPTDWAYEALKSLVERYGCIVGYPDRTFRGNRALSRWEFAAGLNACLNVMERLLQENVAVLREDIDKLRQLTQQFSQELEILGARVDNLETRTAYLEDHVFSTTTKLFNQTILSVDDVFGDRVGSGRNDYQTRLAYRIRMNLETSFTGKDLLRTRLEMSNFADGVVLTGTNMTRLNYDNNSENLVQIPHVWYRTPIADNLTLRLGSAGVGYTDLVDTVTPPTIADDALGIPSKFGEYDPVYRRGGTGGGFNWNLTPKLQLSAGYVAGDGANPSTGNGLFNGNYHALAQLAYLGTDGGLGLTYSHSYFPVGKTDLTASTGSLLAIRPFGDEIATSGDFATIQAYYRFSPSFQVHAWGGYVNAQAQGKGFSNLSDGLGSTVSSYVNWNNSSIWYGLIGFTFPDVGGEGNLPGLVVGIPPTVTASNLASAVGQATPYHIEAFYRLRINDYLSITPGFWAIINPEANSQNTTQFVGHIRTSFLF